MIKLIILGVVAVLCNFFMDEIQFHWNRLFGKIIPKGGRLESWMNPSISWRNKYATKSQFLNFILGSVLVFITDFWHFLKAGFLSCIAIIILILIDPKAIFGDYILWLIIIGGSWWFVFEFTNGIIGAISDRFNKENNDNSKEDS